MPYVDIGKHWTTKAVVRGVEEGLFAPSKDLRFYPDRLMTRAEFLVMLDRLFLRNQQQLQPLTLLSEQYYLGRDDAFEDPYLPYTDVDRLTWMYQPILHASLVLDTLYGPRALNQVFPGKELHPSRPITRGEAARLLQVFTLAPDDKTVWNDITSWSWLEGNESDPLKRGEAAVLADKVMSAVDADAFLPILDMDGMKYPVVPEIDEIFPLFATYVEHPAPDEQAYVDAVQAIRDREDDEQTYEALHKLASSEFPNKIGVHYYLSWNPDTPLEENMEHAFAAIDAYFANKIILPDRLRLLCANVYDIALQMEADDEEIYQKTLNHLQSYESIIRKGTEEWDSLAIYLAALEVRSGQTEKALSRYREMGRSDEAMRNTVHYLAQQGKLDEAEAYLQAIQPRKNSAQEVLKRGLLRELSTLRQQESVKNDLAFALRHFQQLSGYRVDGNAILSGYRFKYTQTVDQRRQTSHTVGYYQAPSKLVMDKLESYADESNHVEYVRDFDKQTWKKSRTDSFDYMHEWVESRSINERVKDLKARYLLQSFGSYDIITEWIPGEEILKKSRNVLLDAGPLKAVPIYINKYYIDRESDTLIAHQWRYEEIYASKKYLAYSGTERYGAFPEAVVHIPAEVVEGTVGTP
nr:S-layer homology domain-containing protein [Brevibacillus sp. SYP-B805]